MPLSFSARSSFPREWAAAAATFAACFLLGIAALYGTAIAHRSEQREVLLEIASVFAENRPLDASMSSLSREVSYRFLDVRADIVRPDDLRENAACSITLLAKTLLAKMRGVADEPLTREVIDRFCRSGGRNLAMATIEPVSAVLVLRPIFDAGAQFRGGEIVVFRIVPPVSLSEFPRYPILFGATIAIALGLGTAVFYWVRRNRHHVDRLTAWASVDGLTGALRRESFMPILDAAITRSRAMGAPLCVLVVDLDNFKAVNDGHGHSAGDMVLKEVVRVARAHLRSTDAIGRLGGDEFAILLPGASTPAAIDIAESIRHAMARSNTNSFGATLSIGVSELAPDDDATQIVKRADALLYAAKGSRNAVMGG